MRLTKAAKGKGSVAGELPTESKSSYSHNIKQIILVNHEIPYMKLILKYLFSLHMEKLPRIEAGLPPLSRGKCISASEIEIGSCFYLIY